MPPLPPTPKDANGNKRPILKGAKTPHWSCECGKVNNWACRVECVCGVKAPEKVRRAAWACHTACLEAEKRAPKAGGFSRARSKKQQTGMSAREVSLAKKVAALEASLGKALAAIADPDINDRVRAANPDVAQMAKPSYAEVVKKPVQAFHTLAKLRKSRESKQG